MQLAGNSTLRDEFAPLDLERRPISRADLVKEFLQSAIDDPELREALPPGFASEAKLKPALRQRMLSALDKMRDGADVDKLIDAFTGRVRAAHARRPDPFRANRSVIDLNSHLQAPLEECLKLPPHRVSDSEF